MQQFALKQQFFIFINFQWAKLQEGEIEKPQSPTRDALTAAKQ